MKPDHMHSLDLDAIVLGAKHSAAAGRAGILSEYILGLRTGASDAPADGSEAKWATFARVGTGLDDAGRARMHAAIMALPLCANPPPCVATVLPGRVTPSEKADVWIAEPWRSEVVAVRADVRAVVSDRFRARYSLRFPRIEAVRSGGAGPHHDLDWKAVKHEDDLVAAVAAAGRLPGRARSGAGGKARRMTRTVPDAMRLPPGLTPAPAGPLSGETVVLGAGVPKAVAARAAQLGARVFASHSPETTLILAPAPETGKTNLGVEVGKRAGVAVLDAAWLDWLAAHPGATTRHPRFFLALGAGDSGAPPGADAHGDPYRVAGTVDDARAVLTRLVPASAVPAPGTPAATEAAAVGYAMLDAAGAGAARRPLAGVRLAVLAPSAPTPDPGARAHLPPDVTAALDAAHAAWIAVEGARGARARAAAAAAGARHATSIADATHAVVLPPRPPPPACVEVGAAPAGVEALLDGVWAGPRGAADLTALRAALARGRLALVSPGFVDAAAGGGAAPDAALFWPEGVARTAEAWDWAAFGVAELAVEEEEVPVAAPSPAPAKRRAVAGRGRGRGRAAAAAPLPPSPPAPPMPVSGFLTSSSFMALDDDDDAGATATQGTAKRPAPTFMEQLEQEDDF